MRSPAVSVVLPTYNRAGLVVRAIRSALDQTFEDVEVLVVDDGSTDGTRDAVLGGFGGEPRVRYLPKENGGTASARNHGLAHARGARIAFLDSDDRFLPDHLALLGAPFDAAGANLAVCDALYDDGTGTDAGTLFGDPDFRPPYDAAAVCDGAWTLPSCTMVAGDLARRLRFDTRYRHCEDTEFLFRFFAAGGRSTFVPRVLTVVRRESVAGAEPRKMDRMADVRLDMLRMQERHADLAPDPRAHLRRLLRSHRALAKDLCRQGRYREARAHLWSWWRRRPDSLTAARWLVRSWFSPR
jgi:glycosyltransferase involved in cell wall biosynthesis